MERLLRILIIIDALPLLAYPALISACPADGIAEKFVWFYPFYVIAASICEWLCVRRRPEVVWILLVVVALTHAAMWALVINPTVEV